ncbi:hypothetical protein DFH08DRAFT_960235 [Mycena albidolilacea]|uniref:Uncharacterized protein n=1 Tax=Mycena albidolilacea TaxID=1033008 RepID=A0AAD7ESJ0_9AGAR|nr:hypothetical protein DFH08DRAFT_960235 [Mycena albidolilacea]
MSDALSSAGDANSIHNLIFSVSSVGTEALDAIELNTRFEVPPERARPVRGAPTPTATQPSKRGSVAESTSTAATSSTDSGSTMLRPCKSASPPRTLHPLTRASSSPWMALLLLRGTRTQLMLNTLGPISDDFDSRHTWAAGTAHWTCLMRPGCRSWHPLLCTLLAMFLATLLVPTLPPCFLPRVDGAAVPSPSSPCTPP